MAKDDENDFVSKRRSNSMHYYSIQLTWHSFYIVHCVYCLFVLHDETTLFLLFLFSSVGKCHPAFSVYYLAVDYCSDFSAD